MSRYKAQKHVTYGSGSVCLERFADFETDLPLPDSGVRSETERQGDTGRDRDTHTQKGTGADVETESRKENKEAGFTSCVEMEHLHRISNVATGCLYDRLESRW